MNTITALLATLLVLLTAPPAFAWGAEGHALIGRIADQLLVGARAGTMVDATLGTYRLEDAAKWADCARSVHRESSGTFRFVPDRYTDPCQAFETAAETARMEDYVRRNWDTVPYRPGRGDHEAYHVAEVPIQDGAYDPLDIGASDHDVVHAIGAAIAALEGKPVPAPFSIRDSKEAILLLAHMIGDAHQPLHVGAVYLDAVGHVVNPRSASEAAADSTAVGIFIAVGSSELHRQWDDIPQELERAPINDLIGQARALPHDPGPVEAWPALWASESVRAAAAAYSGITFVPDGAQRWRAQFVNRAAYLVAQHREQQLRIVQAGGRLAAVLKAIWP